MELPKENEAADHRALAADRPEQAGHLVAVSGRGPAVPGQRTGRLTGVSARTPWPVPHPLHKGASATPLCRNKGMKGLTNPPDTVGELQ